MSQEEYSKLQNPEGKQKSVCPEAIFKKNELIVKYRNMFFTSSLPLEKGNFLILLE